MKRMYLLSFIAATSLCMIATVLNGALPPAPEREQNAKAIELEIGLLGWKKGLGQGETRIIQNLVKPVMKPVCIRNFDVEGCAIFEVYFLDNLGNVVNFAKVFPAPYFMDSPLKLGPSARIVFIPVDEPLTVTIYSNHTRPDMYGSFQLSPQQLENIKEIYVPWDPTYYSVIIMHNDNSDEAINMAHPV